MRFGVRAGRACVRVAMAAVMLLGLALFQTNPAAAEACGGPLSSSTGNVVGSIAGAVGGGLLGSQFGGGAGKGVITGLGVVGGALAGGYAGRSIEGCPHPRQRAAAQAAETRNCRFVSNDGADAQNQQIQGVACLDPDGVWRTSTSQASEQAAERDLVLKTQQSLHDKGFYVRSSIDGRWGPATSKAVRNFQQANSLQASGQIDAPTAAALGVAAVPLSQLTAQANAPAPANPPAQASAAPPAATPVSADHSAMYK